jgi:hypothetical protein
MRIEGIEKMESIIKNSSHLSWNNWTVIAITDDDGYYTKNGILQNGKWKTRYSFEMLDYGVWEIPDRFLTHVQV